MFWGINFEMTMGSGGVARATQGGDRLSLLHPLSNLDQNLTVVGVQGAAAIWMLKLDQVAIATRIPACGDYGSGSSGDDRGALGAARSMPLCSLPQRQP